MVASKHGFLEKLAFFTFNHARSISVLCLALTVLSCFFAFSLKINPDLSALLPARLESLKNHQALKEEFGRGSFLLVVVEGPKDTMIRFAEQLATALSGNPQVLFVNEKKPIDFFKKHGALYLSVEDLKDVFRRLEGAKEAGKKGAHPVFNRLFSLYEGGRTRSISRISRKNI